MYESAWSKTERICVAPAGCPIVMETGECPNCIDKYAEEEENEYTDEYLNGLLAKSKELRITIEDLQGGTFTITNGGIYGSMLSTPILNPPQSGVLGMHNIIERPVVKDGNIIIRPMMYLALSYDHRIIDGKEAF